MSSKFAPLASLVIGLAAGILYTTGTLQEQVLCGITLGLSASGLYSGVKSTAQNFGKSDVPVVGVGTEGSDSDEPED